MKIEFSPKPISGKELCALYASVNDRRASDEVMLSGAWENSNVRVAAWDGDRLAGLARGLSDGHTTLYVCDLLVHPVYQGQGLAAELMRQLCKPHEDIYQTVLITDPETIPFYKKLGFMHWESACLKMRP
ncbi:GNAT family N-acetyltransferase [bacterium]|nr:GNAT family N-acetyltransferase [bacterium]